MAMDKEIVACIGSSTTAGRGTFNWIRELERRPGNERFRFLNFGVGGDLAYNALERLPKVIASKPDKAIVIIGANDILASVFKNVRRFFGGWKGLPQEPSAAWFRENLEAIVRGLKAKTSAEIVIASLAEVGEDPHSDHPVQKELNDRFKEVAEIIKNVAEKENVRYIPLYKRFHEAILASPGQAFTSFRFWHFYRDYVFREFVLRRSFDEIAEMNGWKFHIDGVHLNTRGGMILADLVQGFLDGK